MSQYPPSPSLEKIEARSRQFEELNQRWDALIAIADDMILELEANMRQHPLYRSRVDRAKRLLNCD